MFYERQGSPRLPGYDYSRAGVYFVTFNVHEGRDPLGIIRNGDLYLNECGRIVEETWHWLGQHFHYVLLDESIVMPDHFHGILKIKGEMGVHATEEERLRKPLGQLIGALKTTSARRINSVCGMQGQQFWKHGFHDRILRDPERGGGSSATLKEGGLRDPERGGAPRS